MQNTLKQVTMDYRFQQFEFNIDPVANQSVRQGKSWRGKKTFFKPQKIIDYQKEIQYQYMSQIDRSYETFTGPVKVSVVYVFKYLKKHTKKQIRENEGCIWYKDTKPDLDSNINKPFFDALCGDSIIKGLPWTPAIENDSRIASLQALKMWGPKGKIVLTIETLENEAL